MNFKETNIFHWIFSKNRKYDLLLWKPGHDQLLLYLCINSTFQETFPLPLGKKREHEKITAYICFKMDWYLSFSIWRRERERIFILFVKLSYFVRIFSLTVLSSGRRNPKIENVQSLLLLFCIILCILNSSVTFMYCSTSAAGIVHDLDSILTRGSFCE